LDSTGPCSAAALTAEVPDGVSAPWQNEFYYLDWDATITQYETEGLYNVTVSPQTCDTVVSPE
jgi:hypothetical protein